MPRIVSAGGSDHLNPLPSIVGVNGGVDADVIDFEDEHGDGEDDGSAYVDANGDNYISSNDDMEYEDDDGSADDEAEVWSWIKIG